MQRKLLFNISFYDERNGVHGKNKNPIAIYYKYRAPKIIPEVMVSHIGNKAAKTSN
jgi:hypothetical protein